MFIQIWHQQDRWALELTYRLTEDSSVATQTCSISGVKQRRNTGAEVSQRSVRCSGFLRSVIQTLLSLPDDNTVLKASLVCDNVDNKLRSLSRIIRCKDHDKVITWSVQTPSSCILIVDMHLCWPSDQRRTVPSELAERHWVPSLLTTIHFTLSVCPIQLSQICYLICI